MNPKNRPFTKEGRLDKRLWYYPLLKKLRLVSLKQISKKHISPKEEFIPLKFEGVTIGQLESINYSIAHQLVQEGLLNYIEKVKLVPLDMHTKALSKRTYQLCNKYNIRNLGDAYKRCVVHKKGFSCITEKGFTTTANYQLALLLHRYHLISDTAMRKVQRPGWKLLVPTDDEIIKKDGARFLSETNYPWSDTTKKIICRAVTRKFRYRPTGWNDWGTITVRQLVITFVRIDNNDKSVFYSKNHAGAHRYNKDFFVEHEPKAFPEIRNFLEDNYYLTKPSQEELDRRFGEED